MSPLATTEESGWSEVIGLTEMGRPMKLVHLGPVQSPLKVLITAGQHGDEAGGMEAVRGLLHAQGVFGGRTLPPIHIGVIAEANPDGSSGGRRENAKGLDLNRDHLELRAAETRAIHAFVRAWRPQVVLDVHNYPSRRRHLLAKGLVIDTDVFVGSPTIPGLDSIYRGSVLSESLVEDIKAHLRSLGYSCERYLLFKPSGRVRTSSLGLLDARNSLSARYGVVSALIEGRSPTRDDSEVEKGRLVTAQYEAVHAGLDWAWKNEAKLMEISRSPHLEGPRPMIPVDWRYGTTERKFEVDFREAGTGLRKKSVLDRCLAAVVVTKSVELPQAYAVPLGLTLVREVLRRHGLTSKPLDGFVAAGYEFSATPTPAGSETGKIALLGPAAAGKYELYPTDQDGGSFLALLLEDESRYGLRRHGVVMTCGEAEPLGILRAARKGSESSIRAERGHADRSAHIPEHSPVGVEQD